METTLKKSCISCWKYFYPDELLDYQELKEAYCENCLKAINRKSSNWKDVVKKIIKINGRIYIENQDILEPAVLMPLD